MAVMKNIIKVLIITAFSLNLLQAKATLSIDGYMPKMLFMKVKDGGTVYVDDEKKGITSASGPLVVQIAEGEHNVKVCFPNEKNNMLRICGEQKVYVADDTQASVSIKAERSQSITDLEKCQDGDFKICAELGKAYYYGNGVTKDINKAIQLYEKACDGGIMDGCIYSGIAYQKGEGAATDLGKAVQLYEKACNGKNMFGCTFLGEAYQYGNGVSKDLYKSAQLYEQACDNEEMIGCLDLGNAYYNGNGVAKNLNKAAQLYQKACDGGEAEGCFNLGSAYFNGDGVARDIDKAMKLFQKACDGGDMEGCNVLQRFNWLRESN